VSIAIQNIVKNANGSWTFIWADIGASYYRAVLWGLEQKQVNPQNGFASFTWNKQEYKKFPPPIEIAFEDQQVLSELYVPYLILQWYSDPLASKYQIQQSTDNGATWTVIATLTQAGAWVYSYQTVILIDEVAYKYRVIAIDSIGNQSVARNFVRYVVCPPAPPDPKIKIAYTKPNVVITALS